MNSQNNEVRDWIPTNPDFDPNKPMQIGGQAVIEGVMMRAPGAVATAVRRANGAIVVRYESFRSLVEKHRWMNIPVVRGAIGLIDMMYLGVRTLNFSADVAMMDEDEKAAAAKGEKSTRRSGEPKKESSLAVWGALAVALVVGIGIFFAGPLYIATHIFSLEQSAWAFNLAAGAIRIAILIAYLAAISLMKDVRRLFQYHGAEHKSVFAFELRSPLQVNEVLAFSRFHPRCGTSFLFIVVIVAVFSFALVDSLLMLVLGSLTLPLRLATHLPLIPVVGGIAYEVIKFSARHSATAWGRLLIAPGLWLQRITTKEPDPSQIEVALVALRCALGSENPLRYPLHAEMATASLKEH